MSKYFKQEDVEKTYPEATMYIPMLVWKLPKNKEDKLSEICENGHYYGEIKKDGALYMLNKTKNHTYLFSRTISTKTGLMGEKSANVPHITEAFKSLPDDTVVLGEIYYEGKSSKDVSSIMGCLPPKAIERQKGSYGYICYYIYDILKFKGVDLTDSTAIARKELLEEYLLHENTDILECPYVKMAVTHTENLFQVIEEALANGEEGVVLKKKMGAYYEKKRVAWNTIKIKKKDTVDAICIGACDPTKTYSGKELDTWEYWEDSTGKEETLVRGFHYDKCLAHPTSFSPVTKPYFFGWKTAIEIGAYNDKGDIEKIGQIASGLNDEIREGLAKHPQEYIGKVVEIQCMEKDNAAHTIRHGFLEKFREDKQARECLIKDIF